MHRELEYFRIGDAPCFNQDTYPDFIMRLGGCAATVACETLLFFEQKGLMPPMRPRADEPLTRESFIDFAMEMKPFLRPRMTGIDRLELFTDGMLAYMKAHGAEEGMECCSCMFPIGTLPGDAPFEEAKAALIRQIDREIAVPCLTLQHRDHSFYDYDWHWFMLTGYADGEYAAERIAENPADERNVARTEDAMEGGHLFVQTATYGEYCWLDFDRLWDTGHDRRGGLVLYHDV